MNTHDLIPHRSYQYPLGQSIGPPSLCSLMSRAEVSETDAASLIRQQIQLERKQVEARVDIARLVAMTEVTGNLASMACTWLANRGDTRNFECKTEIFHRRECFFSCGEGRIYACMKVHVW